jgi:hypothetical protein
MLPQMVSNGLGAWEGGDYLIALPWMPALMSQKHKGRGDLTHTVRAM